MTLEQLETQLLRARGQGAVGSAKILVNKDGSFTDLSDAWLDGEHFILVTEDR